ncbi:GNAT family N-acetyltransferase [Candidatus Woesearchaeota archaeon]|nr:GNAT family N-acetyltransferase [Candidatus Woesearchaeota archaeon]
MKINIRETKEDDFEDISFLLNDNKLKDSYFSKGKFLNMLNRNKGLCFVAEDNGKIIGSAFATHDGAFRGYIQKVAVIEDYRRQGIASKLIEKIIQKLEEIEIPLIFCHAEKTNKASLELFKSLGFEIRDSHYLIDKGFKRR